GGGGARRRGGAPPPRGPASTEAATASRSPPPLALAAPPLVLAAAVRFGLPPLQDWLWHAHGVRSASFQPLIFSGVILLHTPYILGSVATLLLLDDLDEGGLRALSVSPLRVRGPLSYRTVSTPLGALFAVAAPPPIARPPARTGWQPLGLHAVRP